MEHLVLPLVTAAERVRRSVTASRAPVRLLVDLPQDMAAALTAAAELPDPAVLDLDAAPYAPPRVEFGDWVRRLLAHHRGEGLSTEQQARTAQLICEQAWPNFVFAESLASDYRSRPAASLPDSLDALPRGLAHAWHDMVTFRSAGRDRLDMVAAPIMLAQGELGMPESLCAEAVEALTGPHGAPCARSVRPPALPPFFRADTAPTTQLCDLTRFAQINGTDLRAEVQESHQQRGYLRLGDDFGREMCLEQATGQVWPVELTSGWASFVNSDVLRFAECLSLLARRWPARRGLNSRQAAVDTAEFQRDLAAIDEACLAGANRWWAVIVEQMWNGLP
ncbi:SUKH-4 family immunity protein [Streptomyces sp. NPDC051684]|uniref:SUKH-4 family immunity protein n=1 Tax=Streptomyces sp. NPDC051684 TaxID=3365670 RepID=UPI0037AAB98E